MQTLKLDFSRKVDLKKTMDIQIPALCWEQLSANVAARIYRINNQCIPVNVNAKRNSLEFKWVDTTPHTRKELCATIKNEFKFLISDLNVGEHSLIRALQDYYGGVVFMQAPAFESLLITILSQGRTAELTRAAYFRLEKFFDGLDLYKVCKTDENTLRELIKIAGPYKAPYIRKCAKIILQESLDTFEAKLARPTTEALDYLQEYPGVGHKTAACVLIFASMKRDVIPIDTHMFRLVNRLGLIRHNGKLNKTNRKKIVSEFVELIPDAGPAHLLFPLLGREFCYAKKPRCVDCPITTHCKKLDLKSEDKQLSILNLLEFEDES